MSPAKDDLLLKDPGKRGISRIRVTGFKAIYDSKMLRLGPLTLLIGRNGTGKSSLLEALQWLQESLIWDLDDATIERFNSFDELCNRRTTEVGIHLTFGTGKREVRYDLSVRHGERELDGAQVARESCRIGRTKGTINSIITRSLRGHPIRQIRRSAPIRAANELALASITERSSPGTARLSRFISNAVFLRLSPTAIAQPSRPRKRSRGPALEETGRNLAALLTTLSRNQLAWVSEQIAQVIGGTRAIEALAEGDSATFAVSESMRSRGGSKVHAIRAGLLSEGTRRLAAIYALLALEPRPPLIAIEEIENGLDPWTLRFVFNDLQNAATEGTQILLTTHSPFLLDYVGPEQVVHVLRKDGDTTFTPIIGYESVAQNMGVVSPGAMYVSGFLPDSDKKAQGGEDQE